MWLLGNLFRTEKRLCALSRYAVEIFQITTGNVMASNMESDGILRDAILVAAELSDSLR